VTANKKAAWGTASQRRKLVNQEQHTEVDTQTQPLVNGLALRERQDGLEHIGLTVRSVHRRVRLLGAIEALIGTLNDMAKNLAVGDDEAPHAIAGRRAQQEGH
jgi:hypothetical protein